MRVKSRYIWCHETRGIVITMKYLIEGTTAINRPFWIRTNSKKHFPERIDIAYWMTPLSNDGRVSMRDKLMRDRIQGLFHNSCKFLINFALTIRNYPMKFAFTFTRIIRFFFIMKDFNFDYLSKFCTLFRRRMSFYRPIPWHTIWGTLPQR